MQLWLILECNLLILFLQHFEINNQLVVNFNAIVLKCYCVPHKILWEACSLWPLFRFILCLFKHQYNFKRNEHGKVSGAGIRTHDLLDHESPTITTRTMLVWEPDLVSGTDCHLNSQPLGHESHIETTT